MPVWYGMVELRTIKEFNPDVDMNINSTTGHRSYFHDNTGKC